jgi:membrane protein
VPFILVLQQLRGRTSASDLIGRFGLDDDASKALRDALTSPRGTSSTISGVSWVFLVLGGLAAAGAIQELYEQVFDVPHRGVAGLPRRVAWLLLLVAAGSLVNAVQPSLYDAGGPFLLGLTTLVGATLFWWCSMRLLLAGRLGWRDLLPAALATGVCWLGMTMAFRLTMSNTITSNYEKYGAIGVVFALMSFLIAVGVVIIIGAVFGAVWRERRAPAPG